MMKLHESTPQAWDDLISGLNGAHILQCWDWGDFKSENGWSATRFSWEGLDKQVSAAAQILEREVRILFLKFKILYIPKGPLLMDWKNRKLFNEVFSDLAAYAKSRKAIFIKIDPDVIQDYQDSDNPAEGSLNHGKLTAKRLSATGWIYSHEQIQFKNTVWIDLKPGENDLLNGMKQKTRYNIRLSQKRGVEIRQAEAKDLAALYDLYAQTAVRDGFIIRPEKYYLSLWERLIKKNRALGLLALVDKKPVAGLILFLFAGKAWYFYGMSSDSHREKMPNYLLQWEAIRAAKQMGCKIYDLWGAPNVLDETNPMWGVVRFKLGLGGKLVQTIGAWDYPVNKIVYNIYVNVLPRVLSLTRMFRRKQLQGEVLNL